MTFVQDRSERNRVDRENMIQECKNPIVEGDFHGFLHRNCEGTEQLHLTEHDFEAWEQGILSDAQMQSFLMHTANCPHCGDAWFAYMSRHTEALPNPPAYLTQEIIERVHQPDVVIAQKARRTSKRVQLFLYSLKVGVALAASIYMIFTMDTQMFDLMTNFTLFK